MREIHSESGLAVIDCAADGEHSVPQETDEPRSLGFPIITDILPPGDPPEPYIIVADRYRTRRTFAG